MVVSHSVMESVVISRQLCGTVDYYNCSYLDGHYYSLLTVVFGGNIYPHRIVTWL